MSSLFDIINVPLGWIMRLCYQISGDNYVVALLFFALILQILLLPFAVKQQKNSVRQAKLAPKIAAINKKYAGRTDQATLMKKQQEIQDFYRKENFSQFSGCLPMLIQMPILLALYQVAINPLRYITGLSGARIEELTTYVTDTLGQTLNQRSPFLDLLKMIRENPSGFYAVAPELEGAVLPSMQLGPFDFSQVPTMALNWLLVVPIATFVFALVTQKITRMFMYQSPEAVEAQKSPSMKIMNYSMPLLSVWIAFTVPAAIGVYWVFRNIITCIQQIILALTIPTPKYSEEEYKAAEREMKVGRAVEKKKKAEGTKVPPRSLHYIDDEEYQARREAALAAQAEETEASSEERSEETPAALASAEADRLPEEIPVLKDDPKVTYERKKPAPSPSSGPKYQKTGKNYKK